MSNLINDIRVISYLKYVMQPNPALSRVCMDCKLCCEVMTACTPLRLWHRIARYVLSTCLILVSSDGLSLHGVNHRGRSVVDEDKSE